MKTYATARDAAYLLKTGSVKAMANTLSVDKPISLLALLRKLFQLAQPRTPENPKPDGANTPLNVVLSWSDPGAGQVSQARWFDVSLQGAGSKTWNGSTVTYSTSLIYSGQPLSYATNYQWGVAALGYFGGASATAFAQFKTVADPNAQPIGQPQPTAAYSKILLHNCSSLHYAVNLWTKDVTAGEDWKDQGSLPDQYDDSGICPGNSAPKSVDLVDGHHYVILLVAPQQCGKNDPTLANCIAWPANFIPFPITGAKNGPPWEFTFTGA